MPLVLRPYEPDTDATRVAELFTRLKYGSASRAGIPLTAHTLNRVFAESGMRFFCVAEDEGLLVGTVGLMERADGLASGPGELFADHYLVDPVHRNGFVSGRLLGETFRYMVTHHVRTVRLRVDPSNKVAFRLYVRSGFRAIGSMTPAADGFVEMVNHLPGMLGLLAVVLSEDQDGRAGGGKIPAGFFGQFMRRLRQRGERGGVSERDDQPVQVSYDFALADRDFHIVLDGLTGILEEFSVNGVDRTAAAQDIESHELPEPVSTEDEDPVLAVRQVGNFGVRITRDGHLEIDHPDQVGPVLTDVFPDGEGMAVAPSRPARHSVTVSRTDDGWQTTGVEGFRTVTRRITLRDNGIDVDCTVDTEQPDQLVMFPRCQLRTAELTIAGVGSEPRTAAVREGAWPVHMAGFEAAADESESLPADGSSLRWADAGAGLGVRIMWRGKGILRPSGMCVAAGPAMSYRIELTDLEDQPPWSVDEPAGEAGPLDWSPGPRRTMQYASDESTTVVVGKHGLDLWSVSGLPLLRTPPRNRRGFGPMRVLPAAMWPDLAAPRHDPIAGMAWTQGTSEFAFLPDGLADAREQPGWTVEATPSLETLVVSLSAPPAADGGEMVLTVKPTCAGVWLADSTGQESYVESGAAVWRAWTRRVGLPLDGGGRLVIQAIEGDHPAILVRSIPAGFLVSMFSVRSADQSSIARWEFAFEQGEGDGGC